MEGIKLESFLRKQRAMYDILNDKGKGTNLNEICLLCAKLMAQYVVSRIGKDNKTMHKFLMEFNSLFEKNFEIICQIQEELPDDLGCAVHAFKSEKEAKKFLEKNKEKIKQAETLNMEFAKKIDADNNNNKEKK